MSIDRVLIGTDRVSSPGPAPWVDLRWSGKHANRGGNATALRTHAAILPALAEAAGDLRSLGAATPY